MAVPTTLINQGRDQNGYINNWYNEMSFSNNVYVNVLTAAVASIVIVPEGVNVAVFNWTQSQDLWVGNSASPSTSKFLLLEDGDKILLENGDRILLEGTGAFASSIALNPKIKTVLPGDIINLLCANACNVSIEFFNRPRQFA